MLACVFICLRVTANRSPVAGIISSYSPLDTGTEVVTNVPCSRNVYS